MALINRVLFRVLSFLFPVCFLEGAVWIVVEQHLLLKIIVIFVKSRRDAFFSPAVWYNTPLVCVASAERLKAQRQIWDILQGVSSLGV